MTERRIRCRLSDLRQTCSGGAAAVLQPTLCRRRSGALADRAVSRARPADRSRRGASSGRRTSRLIGSDGMGYGLPPARSPDAQVAQLVEHATENRSVGGSIPPLGTIPFYSTVSFHRRATL